MLLLFISKEIPTILYFTNPKEIASTVEWSTLSLCALKAGNLLIVMKINNISVTGFNSSIDANSLIK
jgi:hypothetical protein